MCDVYHHALTIMTRPDSDSPGTSASESQKAECSNLQEIVVKQGHAPDDIAFEPELVCIEASMDMIKTWNGVGASTAHTWTTLSSSGADDVCVMTSESMDDPDRPPGLPSSYSVVIRLIVHRNFVRIGCFANNRCFPGKCKNYKVVTSLRAKNSGILDTALTNKSRMLLIDEPPILGVGDTYLGGDAGRGRVEDDEVGRVLHEKRLVTSLVIFIGDVSILSS
ncbi:hypothetical protein Tco_1184562 [Tanacetum coccineum]